MTLTDTGPLVALLNRNNPNHAACVAATQRLPAGPLMTTWPCFTEAMHLLFRTGGAILARLPFGSCGVPGGWHCMT